MKKLLSLLLPIVLLNGQAFALSGGPVYGSTNVDIIGTYSGVLVPTEPNLVDEGEENESSASAIGIFTLAQDDVGVATGSVVLFVDGTPFTGAINAVIDPGDGSVRGVIDGSSTYTVTVFIPTTEVVDGNVVTSFDTEDFNLKATGNIDARVVPTNIIGNAGGLNSARLVGEASVDVFFNTQDDGSPDVSRTVSFDVEGFKQSNTSTTSDIDFGTNLTGF